MTEKAEVFINVVIIMFSLNKQTVAFVINANLFHSFTTTNKYSRVSNRMGGWNKREDWQILVKIINKEGPINGEVSKKSPKLINEEVGISGETGKNIAIRNIKIKSSNDLVKISTKRT